MARFDARFELEDSLAMRDDDGNSALRIVLGATFYLPAGFDRGAAFDAINGIASVITENLRWAKNTTTFDWELLESGNVKSYLSQASSVRPDQELEFGLRSGDVSSEATDFSISGLFLASWQSDPSYFKFTVPITFFADRDDAFVSLVKSTIQKCPPLHGYGGLMIAEAQNRNILQKFEPIVYSIAQRFMGLEVDRPYSHLAYVPSGIKSVNWLTFVDHKLIYNKPEIATWLEKPTLETIKTGRIGSTVFVQSGERPEIGDKQKQRYPTAYVETAKQLKSIKITLHRSFHSGLPGRFTRETSEEWLQRLEQFTERDRASA